MAQTPPVVLVVEDDRLTRACLAQFGRAQMDLAPVMALPWR